MLQTFPHSLPVEEHRFPSGDIDVNAGYFIAIYHILIRTEPLGQLHSFSFPQRHGASADLHSLKRTHPLLCISHLHFLSGPLPLFHTVGRGWEHQNTDNSHVISTFVEKMLSEQLDSPVKHPESPRKHEGHQKG